MQFRMKKNYAFGASLNGYIYFFLFLLNDRRQNDVDLTDSLLVINGTQSCVDVCIDTKSVCDLC